MSDDDAIKELTDARSTGDIAADLILSLKAKVRELEAERDYAEKQRREWKRFVDRFCEWIFNGPEARSPTPEDHYALRGLVQLWDRIAAAESERDRLAPLAADANRRLEAVAKACEDIARTIPDGPAEGWSEIDRRLLSLTTSVLAATGRGPSKPPPESPESDERIVDGLMREAQAGRGERAIERREPEAAEQGDGYCELCGKPVSQPHKFTCPRYGTPRGSAGHQLGTKK
jgi:hypothetical protein